MAEGGDLLLSPLSTMTTGMHTPALLTRNADTQTDIDLADMVAGLCAIHTMTC